MYSNGKLNENPGTKLSLENWGKIHSFETSHSDMDTTELVEAFYGLMVAATFSEIGTLEVMRDFAEERLAYLKPKSIEE